MAQRLPLTTSLILRLKLQGFNGFYLLGCHDSKQYILHPTIIEGIVENDLLRTEVFQRIKYFEETEILEMLNGDEFIDFVVEMPEVLSYPLIRLN